MNKLEEYRDRLANEYGDWSKPVFEHGFDTAIVLDLPVKFVEWIFSQNIDISTVITLADKNNEEVVEVLSDAKELYQYWIDNIYKPE